MDRDGIDDERVGESETTLLLARRSSGTLLFPMLVNAAWDFSTFAGLPTATEATIAVTMTIVIGVLGLIFVVPALRKTKGQKVEQYA